MSDRRPLPLLALAAAAVLPALFLVAAAAFVAGRR